MDSDIPTKGSFRVTQKIALRATTAAPTFFKPLLSFDELYVDGGIVASNPSAVAVHEAKAVYPGVSTSYATCKIRYLSHKKIGYLLSSIIGPTGIGG